ncbi:hypothetical protein, partial [Chromobacterium amazonense]|uniref:hypothetical protein n=1 Tax=Chromobacterium amazonense TaxID=1382803 RepID=UPI0031F68FE8
HGWARTVRWSGKLMLLRHSAARRIYSPIYNLDPMKILHIATDGNQVFAIAEVRAMCEDRGIPVFLSLIRFDLSRGEEVLKELLKTGYLSLSNAWEFEERLGRASHRYAKTFEVRASHFADYRYQGPRSR